MSRSRILSYIIGCVLLSLTGCAAITNPVANGVPARLVPEELLVASKEEVEPVPLQWLRRSKDPGDYKLDVGDILGVYIEGVLPAQAQNLPINFPQSTSLPPSSGIPVAIRENGTISLPLIPPVKVQGLSLEQTEQRIKEAYIQGLKGDEEEDVSILQEGQARIMVEIARPRYTRVIVIREDNPNQRSPITDPSFRTFGAAPLAQGRGQGSGNVIEIPALEADVLTALTNTGGPPGPNSRNEIIIYRGFRNTAEDDATKTINDMHLESEGSNSNIIRIPTRLTIGSEKPFKESDIRLQDDDIIFIPARTTDVYYTGGILPAREVPLPPEYDLRALEAVLRVGGSVINGGRFTNNFTGSSFTTGVGNASPSLLTVIRRTPRGGQVTIRVDLNRALRDSRENILIQEGDILLLQETPAEAVNRYLTTAFNFSGVANIFSRGSAAANASANLP